MTKLFANTAAAALLSAIGLVVAQADVVGSGAAAAPGAYGRVDTSVYRSPVLVTPDAVTVQSGAVAEPQYLWVPAEQRTHWAQYCDQYAACGAPVYFVQDNWYTDTVLNARRQPPQ